MFEIQILKVGSMGTNCYLLIDVASNHTVIVDPGDDSEYIKDFMMKKDLKPIRIIATHAHFDHVMAALDLRLSFTIPFMLNEKDLDLLKKMGKSSIFFTGLDPGPVPQVDKFVNDKDIVTFGKSKLSVIETPGHTPGSISIILKHKGEFSIFVGDILFSDGSTGRHDLSYSNSNDLNRSVKKILAYPDTTLLYPGHGDCISVGTYKSIMSRDSSENHQVQQDGDGTKGSFI